MIKINRKSQGLSINVVIIIALALIVFVVLTAIFTGRVRIFSQTLEDCESKQGRCDIGCKVNEAKITGAKCSTKEKPICCIQILDT